ncbi:hypothetical protein ACWDYJ_25810 [Streptomyces sp. NPDC003042]
MTPYVRAPSRGGALAGRIVALAANVAAVLILAWIVLWLLDANRSHTLVALVHDAATWLAGWSYDLFTFDREWVQVVVGYGLAAVVYLVVGHALARFLYRL